MIKYRKLKGQIFSFAVIVSFLLLCLTSAYALDSVPKESGFSGFLRLGGGALNYKSNMVAGNDFMDVGTKTISSLTTGPDSESTGFLAFNGELTWTFASTRTQLTLGSQMEDIARLENAQQLAVKQELPDKSLISLGFLFTGIPTETWKDPYIVNSPREETDRDSTGAKFAFDKILGTNLQFVYTYRDISVDVEQSGVALGLTQAERGLLKRDGDNHKIDLLYRFNFNNTHIIEPGVTYINQDRDGEAMSNDGYEFKLTYLYFSDPLTLVATGSIGKTDYDKENPIYTKTQEDDLYLLGVQAYYKNPFGWKPFGYDRFSVYCSLSYFYQDANIDFYDTEFTAADVGVMFRF